MSAEPLEHLTADEAEAPALFVDVGALLAGGVPEPPQPVLLTRDDGVALFYAGKVNVLFGDPECGKTMIACAAAVEALRAGRRVCLLDIDHNGAAELVTRLVTLGAPPHALADPDRFRLAEPEDGEHLIAVVAELRAWRPAVAVVDSLGELLPMLSYSSNSPDDYTTAHRRVPGALARAGAAVIAIDHMPKSDDARVHGQTGTIAKRRAVNGVTLRVTLREAFAPGRGGAAGLTIAKDRPGGLRARCPADGKSQPAGVFALTAEDDGTTSWRITAPHTGDTRPTTASVDDVAELDALDPPPTSVRDVKRRLGWGSDRSSTALDAWRQQCS